MGIFVIYDLGVCISVRTCVYIYIYIYMCVCVCVCVCEHVFENFSYTHIYILIYYLT